MRISKILRNSKSQNPWADQKVDEEQVFERSMISNSSWRRHLQMTSQMLDGWGKFLKVRGVGHLKISWGVWEKFDHDDHHLILNYSSLNGVWVNWSWEIKIGSSSRNLIWDVGVEDDDFHHLLFTPHPHFSNAFLILVWGWGVIFIIRSTRWRWSQNLWKEEENLLTTWGSPPSPTPTKQADDQIPQLFRSRRPSSTSSSTGVSNHLP